MLQSDEHYAGLTLSTAASGRALRGNVCISRYQHSRREGSMLCVSQAVEANLAERRKPADQAVSYLDAAEHTARPESSQGPDNISQDMQEADQGEVSKEDYQEDQDKAESGQASGVSEDEAGSEEEEDEAASTASGSSEVSSSQAVSSEASGAASEQQAEVSSQPASVNADAAGPSQPGWYLSGMLHRSSCLVCRGLPVAACKYLSRLIFPFLFFTSLCMCQ